MLDLWCARVMPGHEIRGSAIMTDHALRYEVATPGTWMRALEGEAKLARALKLSFERADAWIPAPERPRKAGVGIGGQGSVALIHCDEELTRAAVERHAKPNVGVHPRAKAGEASRRPSGATTG